MATVIQPRLVFETCVWASFRAHFSFFHGKGVLKACDMFLLCMLLAARTIMYVPANMDLCDG